uniref:Uncharacterized protein n=1 Tax=Physcomitrium patens TaxID=3218 RepID=A0A2K1IW63_PHYPA|nr:hypothetical protein PHYPA_025459 [Physcomitrium patens]
MIRAGGELKGSNSDLLVNVPEESAISDYVTASDTFQDDDIMLNKEGIRVVSQTETSTVIPMHREETTCKQILQELKANHAS